MFLSLAPRKTAFPQRFYHWALEAAVSVGEISAAYAEIHWEFFAIAIILLLNAGLGVYRESKSVARSVGIKTAPLGTVRHHNAPANLAGCWRDALYSAWLPSCGFFPSRFVIFPNTIRSRIAGQGFLRGTGIALEKRRRALRDYATRKYMRKAMKILLAVDGSESGLAAVEEAARTPWPEGSMVRIVSVTDIPFPTQQWAMPMPTSSYEEWERIFEERSVENTAQAMARFGEIAGARTEAQAKTLKGDPKIAILDEAERWGADLIIVGTHGYNALERLWLGSVSRAVASHAKCSVEIARRRKAQGAEGKAMRILLAVDGSEFGDAAVEEIANRPWPLGSEVHVISVIHLPFTPTLETWALPDSYYSKLEKAEREQAGSAINRATSRLLDSNSEREAPLTLTSEAIMGHAAETIIETAKKWGADLVALGSHGRHGFSRFLLGSVSYAVASHAPCSVEIVCKSILQEGEK